MESQLDSPVCKQLVAFDRELRRIFADTQRDPKKMDFQIVRPQGDAVTAKNRFYYYSRWYRAV